MSCANCRFWKRGTLRRYANTERYESAETEKGSPCRAAGPLLGFCTPGDFSCSNYRKFNTKDDQVEVVINAGEPWQVWRMVPCPDCSGNGSNDSPTPGCHRCVGTGNVRAYDDGYVGEERTREHPRDREERLVRMREDRLTQARAEIAASEVEPPPVTPETPRGELAA
jgi:hypothetical protein